MKIGLVSDVHGDADALERALALLDRAGANRILCAGDLVGYGPEPDRTVCLLRDRGVCCVRGNHDRWALSRRPGAPDPSGGASPASAATREFLADLPPLAMRPLAGRLVVVAHGVPGDDTTYLTPDAFSTADLDGLLSDLGADVLVVGHTHGPAWYSAPAGGLVVNPGSVLSCVPGVRSSRTCAVLDLEELAATFHDLESGDPIHVAPWADDGAGRAPAV